MKSFLILLSLVLFNQNGHAMVLTCDLLTDYSYPVSQARVKRDKKNNYYNQSDWNEHYGIFSRATVECWSGERTSFTGTLRYYAPGVTFGTGEGFLLTCPLVRSYAVKRRIHNGKSWNVAGPRIAVGGLLGIDGGVLMNHRLAACTLTGISLQAGAAIGIANLTLDEFRGDEGGLVDAQTRRAEIEKQAKEDLNEEYEEPQTLQQKAQQEKQ